LLQTFAAPLALWLASAFPPSHPLSVFVDFALFLPISL
jgi:hypothetical protein